MKNGYVEYKLPFPLQVRVFSPHTYALCFLTSSMDSIVLFACMHVCICEHVSETCTHTQRSQDTHFDMFACLQRHSAHVWVCGGGCGMSNDCLQPAHFSISAVEQFSIGSALQCPYTDSRPFALKAMHSGEVINMWRRAGGGVGG